MNSGVSFPLWQEECPVASQHIARQNISEQIEAINLLELEIKVPELLRRLSGTRKAGLLVNNVKPDTHDLAHEKEHVHGHQTVPSDLALRVKALESLLVEKGLVDPRVLDALIDSYEHKIGARNGTRVVARAWVDPAYKERLLTDATAAIGELGYTGAQGEHMMVVAHGPKVDLLAKGKAPIFRLMLNRDSQSF
jgi:hypothetical protein